MPQCRHQWRLRKMNFSVVHWDLPERLALWITCNGIRPRKLRTRNEYSSGENTLMLKFLSKLHYYGIYTNATLNFSYQISITFITPLHNFLQFQVISQKVAQWSMHHCHSYLQFGYIADCHKTIIQCCHTACSGQLQVERANFNVKTISLGKNFMEKFFRQQ